MRRILALTLLLSVISVFSVQATVYTGVMDNRAGQQFIPGMTAQSKAWTSGGNPGEGVRLEWQVDNVNSPGSWTYTYRLLRGTSKNKGFAFFDIETASDFTAANILSRQVVWALNRLGSPIPSGLAAVTIGDPVNFTAIHNFTNAAVTEASSLTALNKGELSHYSGDPGRVSPGQPGLDASYTSSVGPVPHPFYGIRVTFPGSFANLAYEASEWEFKIVSDRPPMWGSFFGWGDQTNISPFWYANVYNNTIDNQARLTLPPASCNFGESPYQGWILVPGPLPSAQSSFLTVDLVSYSRDTSGEGYINMFASALANSNLNLTISGNGFASPVIMAPDTPNPVLGGKYMAHIPFTSLPDTVQLDNSFDPAAVPPYPVRLVDEVNISQAIFNPQTRTMTIKAASQDRMASLPTLTAVDFAAPNQFDATGTFTKTLTANPPSTVTVISSKGGAATSNVNISTQLALPVSAVTIVADKPSPHVTGASVTFTAVGSGGSGSYEYDFWVFNGTVWAQSQAYSASPTFSWNTAGLAVGNYTIAVHARNAGTTGFADASVFLPYQITAPANSVVVSANTPSPQLPGTPITISAAISGGSGSYEYQFLLFNGTSWSLVQDYASSPLWVWDSTGLTAGNYQIGVNVRSVGSGAAFETNGFLSYTLTAPVTGVTVISDQPTPHTQGTPVIFAASGVGGRGVYEYRFSLFDGNNWALVQNYSGTSFWALSGARPAGSYVVAVEVRNAGSTNNSDAVTYTSYVIQ